MSAKVSQNNATSFYSFGTGWSKKRVQSSHLGNLALMLTQAFDFPSKITYQNSPGSGLHQIRSAYEKYIRH